MICTVYSLTVM